MTTARSVIASLPEGVTFYMWSGPERASWAEVRRVGMDVRDIMSVDAPEGWHWTGYHGHGIPMPPPGDATAAERWEGIAEDMGDGLAECTPETCPDPTWCRP